MRAPAPAAPPSLATAPVLDALALLAGAREDGARVVRLPALGWLGMLARERRAGRVRSLLVALPSARAPARLAAPDRDVLLRALPARRWLARTMVGAVPGSAAAMRLAPAVAVTAGRDGSEPLALERLVPDGDARRLAILPSRHHLAVAGVWPRRGPEPVAWVKVGDIAVEERALRAIGPGAAAAGARVPLVLGSDARLLATAALTGEHAHDVLRREPRRLSDVVDQVLAWLVAWRERSSTERELGAADVDRLLLAPAQELAAQLDRGYVAWLDGAFGALAGRRCTLSAAHHDLTMFNVMLDGARLGVLDWEAATEDALPFSDAPYAVVDAEAAAHGYADRVAAFERVFGAAESALRRRLRALADAATTDRVACSAAFHAGWLAHAVNDLRRHGSGGEFVRIAARLSADPRGLDPFAS